MGDQLFVSLSGVVRDHVADITRDGTADISYLQIVNDQGEVLSTFPVNRDITYEQANRSFWRPHAYQSETWHANFTINLSSVQWTDASVGDSDLDEEPGDTDPPKVGELTFYVRTSPNATGRRGETSVKITVENLSASVPPTWAVTQVKSLPNLVHQVDWQPFVMRVLGDKPYLLGHGRTVNWRGKNYHLGEGPDGNVYVKVNPVVYAYFNDPDPQEDADPDDEESLEIDGVTKKINSSWTFEGMLEALEKQYGQEALDMLVTMLRNECEIIKVPRQAWGGWDFADNKILITDSFWFGASSSNENAAKALYAALKKNFDRGMVGDGLFSLSKVFSFNLRPASQEIYEDMKANGMAEGQVMTEAYEEAQAVATHLGRVITEKAKEEATWFVASWLGGRLLGVAFESLQATRALRVAGEVPKGLKFANWKATEEWLHSVFGGGKQFFREMKGAQVAYKDASGKLISITFKGGRYPDQFIEVAGKKFAREAKCGFMELSPRLRVQALKDEWMLKNGHWDVVEWHFFVGPNGGGLSEGLEKFLLQRGIKVVKHF